MAESDLKIRCQRCGEQMEMKDPAQGDAWKPDQFWVCPKCGRHFWTTYPNPPGTAPAAARPAAPAAGATPVADKPAAAPAAPGTPPPSDPSKS